MSTLARETSARGLAFTLAALLVLAGLSLALHYANLGSLGFLAAFGIATVKVVLVAVFFMEILLEKGSARIAFVTGFVLLALLISLTIADVLTRAVPPLQNPPGTAPRTFG
jgi:cytochrome c oxidase subunit 4